MNPSKRPLPVFDNTLKCFYWSPTHKRFQFGSGDRSIAKINLPIDGLVVLNRGTFFNGFSTRNIPYFIVDSDAYSDDTHVIRVDQYVIISPHSGKLFAIAGIAACHGDTTSNPVVVIAEAEGANAAVVVGIDAEYFHSLFKPE